MSGGRFGYLQYRIREIADEIERAIAVNGKPDECTLQFMLAGGHLPPGSAGQGRDHPGQGRRFRTLRLKENSHEPIKKKASSKACLGVDVLPRRCENQKCAVRGPERQAKSLASARVPV